MVTVNGKSAFGGIVIGRIKEFAKKDNVVRRTKVDDIATEIKRFEDAKEVAVNQLGALYEKAVKEVGEIGRAHV